MNYIYNKTFFSEAKEEVIKKKIEHELKKWDIDEIHVKKDKITFRFTFWKFGSNIKSFNQINKGYFELFYDKSQIRIEYRGYYSITTELILILFFTTLGLLIFWFFFIAAIGISIQLSSRISNLNKIQSEMIKRLSEK